MIGVKYITPAELKQYEHALEDIINVVYETTWKKQALLVRNVW